MVLTQSSFFFHTKKKELIYRQKDVVSLELLNMWSISLGFNFQLKSLQIFLNQ